MFGKRGKGTMAFQWRIKKQKPATLRRRSNSGYFSLVGGNLVTWKSKKQKVIFLSSVEAEFRGIAKGMAEALWIRKLVSEIGFPLKESIQIMSNNKAAIQISENPMQHDRTKHVEVDRHFIKEKLEARIIKLPFVKYEDQLADILTKAVGMVILYKCLNKLNFGDPTIQLKGECNLVTWKSKKQKVIFLSSVEAEFRGIAKGMAEALWIRKLVSEIGFPLKESIQIMSNNKAAIQISENPMQHDRTKHVEVDRHFIKEKLEARIIKLPFVKYEDQLADILTKAVGMVILYKCLNKLNFGDPTIQLKGEFATMQVNVQFLQQLQPKWSRFVTIVKQQHKLDEVSYHKLFDILKQYPKEVNELHAERIGRNANPLALVATAQSNQDPYYQTPKSHKPYAPTSKTSILTRSYATTRNKGKKIAKSITPPFELASKEDSDPKQAQRDKDMQKNLALIAKYFEKIYKPTNNNLKTSSNSRNKNVDTTPRNQKRVKDSTYDKEKMLMCKQAEQGRYAQWRSRFLRYIDTRPNGDALRKCILEEVNELHAERIGRNANPLALVATAQSNQDPYYQTPKSYKPYAPTSKTSILTRSHATTRNKGKKIAKSITPPFELASKEDSDPKQAQRDKDMQKNLALIAKYFEKIYKPTNNNLRTSSNSRNKNVDTTPRYRNDNQSAQFGNQRIMTVAGAKENVGSLVVQQTVIQCFNCKEFVAKECRNPKRVKDSTYHKEKMLLCKQAEQGVPL
nr:putative copia-type protein [Tanacetum cinerariifolium]